ncbi:MAG TPA: hypothetical protein VGG79_04565 [Roseiarcus sp.]
MAKPTFDAELATNMTVNAKLLKTPQRKSPPAGASELMLDSLDKKASWKNKSRKANARRNPRSNGEHRLTFQGASALWLSRLKTA